MRLKIIDVREDYKGDLWFLCENYYTPSQDSELNESWWLHLSDEYAEMRVQDGPVNGKQWKLVKV